MRFTYLQYQILTLKYFSYPQTDVVIICYNVMVPHSLKNVSAKWIFEVREHMPNKPVLLGKYDGFKKLLELGYYYI